MYTTAGFSSSTFRMNSELSISAVPSTSSQRVGELAGLMGYEPSHGSFVMNWDRIEGNWKQLFGLVKEKWGKFTDDELLAIVGRREPLAGMIQERYRCSIEQAERELDEFNAPLD